VIFKTFDLKMKSGIAEVEEIRNMEQKNKEMQCLHCNFGV